MFLLARPLTGSWPFPPVIDVYLQWPLCPPSRPLCQPSGHLQSPHYIYVEIPWGQKCRYRAAVLDLVSRWKRPVGGLLLQTGSLCLRCTGERVTGSVDLAVPLTFGEYPLCLGRLEPRPCLSPLPPVIFKVEEMDFPFPLPHSVASSSCILW